MKQSHQAIMLAVALSVPMLASAQGVGVHSAAGVLPGDVPTQPANTSPRNYANPDAFSVASTTTTPTTPPPLPGVSRAAPTPSTGSAPSAPAARQTAAKRNPTPATGSTSPRPAVSAIASFDDVLSEKVTIDVVDMPFSDLLDSLSPSGWRVRTQNIDPATLAQRVDLTAQATRGEVLYELLAQANLTAKPFEGFDTPLLLITRR